MKQWRALAHCLKQLPHTAAGSKSIMDSLPKYKHALGDTKVYVTFLVSGLAYCVRTAYRKYTHVVKMCVRCSYPFLDSGAYMSSKCADGGKESLHLLCIRHVSIAALTEGKLCAYVCVSVCVWHIQSMAEHTRKSSDKKGELHAQAKKYMVR